MNKSSYVALTTNEVTNIDTPPNCSRDRKVGSRMKQQKKKKVEACSLTHNTLGLGGHAGASKWD